MGGETISERAHQRIALAFHCLIHDGYSTAECPFIAVSCPEGWLHVCSERTLIEPVDENYLPVLAGQPSHTALLTNLINHVQPIIRYDLGYSITTRPDPCPCGNPFPAIKVLGRKNDILHLVAADGSVKNIPPMIFNALIDILPGVQRWQIIQSAPSTLSVRLATTSQADDASTWTTIAQRLQSFCEQQDLSSVKIERSADTPAQDPATGKFYQVRAQLHLSQEHSAVPDDVS